TDVRSDHDLDGIVAVVDDTGLVPTQTGTKKVAGGDPAQKLATVMDGAAGAEDGALQAANKLSVHPMPEARRDRIRALGNGAHPSTDLEIYQLQDRGVVCALAAAAKRHVKVRVMLEPKTVGSRNFTPVSKLLSAAGVDVKETPPAFDSQRNVDHAKFAI